MVDCVIAGQSFMLQKFCQLVQEKSACYKITLGQNSRGEYTRLTSLVVIPGPSNGLVPTQVYID